jgi:uncharacterized protein
MWISIARIILKNRLAISVVIGFMVLLFAFFARKAEISYEYVPLLPTTDSTYITNQYFKKLFHQHDNLVIIAFDASKMGADDINRWIEFRKRLLEFDGIMAVTDFSNSFSLSKNSDAERFEPLRIFPDTLLAGINTDSLFNMLYDLPFYRGKLYNPETNVFISAVTLNPAILESQNREGIVLDIEREALSFSSETKIPLYISGLPYIRIVTAQIVREELLFLMILAFFVCAIIMFLIFRSSKVVLVSLLVVGIGVLFSFALMGISGYKITIITGMIPPLLVVIGIPNSVFLINKFQQEYVLHGNKIKALQRSIRKIGNATFFTNITTASGFATFIITESPLLVQFGKIAAVNILFLYIVSITVIPIAFSYLPSPKEKHTRHLENRFIGKISEWFLNVVLYRRIWVYTVLVCFLLLSIVGFMRLKISGYVFDDIPNAHHLLDNLSYIEQNYHGVMPLEIIIDTHKKRKATSLPVLKNVDELQNNLDSSGLLTSPVSYVEGVKFFRQAYFNGNSRYYALPSQTEGRLIQKYAKNSIGSSMQIGSLFTDSMEQVLRISYFVKDLGKDELIYLRDSVREICNQHFPPENFTTHIVGGSIVHLEGTDYLIKNLYISLLLAILLISGFMAYLFSSLRMVFVAIIPNLIPLIITAALMGFLGIPIKASTILVFSISFGISIDNTIHYLAKYRQDLFETGWSIKASVVMALKETGVSMFYTSVILFFGFGIFALSSFGGTKALGILVSVTLLVAMFSNLLLLPSLLLTLDKYVTNKDFSDAGIDVFQE